MSKQAKKHLNCLVNSAIFSFSLALLLNPLGAIAQKTPNDIIIDTSGQGSTPPPPPVNTSYDHPRFTCQMERGKYTVMYHPESQGSQPYPWAIPSDLGDGWTAQRRCNEISRRLEMYRPDGLLELKTGRQNNYNTICVTTQQDAACRIVLTVPPGKNAEITRNQIFQTLVAAEEGQYGQGVNAFSGGNSGNSLGNQLGQLLNGKIPQMGRQTPTNTASNAINLRPFLDPSDGGTGSKLRKNPSNSPSNSRTLNPDKYR
ncbi:COP23 domain-containing protein [Aphanothece sacrum]|uniref:Circadian oscillating COP23 family protein n=1 Tax=Aphanothece sacrum FPU1 TaxID=1920663 RepID=A0A401IG07_APHSA|nr:COP23 domain-containing protein [Aphanothece sacrum]GBF80222.1 circadian oscillating COP23 family protein [Aphanothece sacrum FPU1]GBF85375.1 hypothetical protein AsFPU3_2434 [Aphanothece sacrum FPU3]